MKPRRNLNLYLFVVVLGLVALISGSAFAAETYKVDPVHTTVVFRIKHLGVAYAYGRFNGPSGFFVFDESSPSKSTIEVHVNAKDVDTAVEKRDNHLRGPDFFNAGEHPLVSFKSTAVKKLKKDSYEVSGNLTLLGKSRPLSVTAQGTGSGDDPWGKYRRGFETSFTIKRSEFGMNFMLGGLSDEVVVTVSVEGIRQ